MLRWALAFALLVSALVAAAFVMISMPGKGHAGPLPPLTESQRALAADLGRSVQVLAQEIGDRNVARPDKLAEAADWIAAELERIPLAPQRQAFSVHGFPCANVWAEISGGARRGEIVIVGAHYDSVVGCPGANDNATGVAALLALARRLAPSKPARTLRFVAFANEEPPWFQTEAMGSLVYARACKERGENVVAMLSLETMGYFSEVEGSQSYPLPILGWIYPTRGNFITFVGNFASRALVRTAIATFRESVAFPSEGAALPDFVPGIGWSDQWSFWAQGYPALMVTDTAPFRYPHYHTVHDTADKVDCESLARVVDGLTQVVARLSDR